MLGILAVSVNDFCAKTEEIWQLIGAVIKILQIAIPIIIILLGTIDLGKAVMAGEDKQIKEAQRMFLRRLIYGVAVFFVVMIVRAVFGVLGNRDTTTSQCFNAAAGRNE